MRRSETFTVICAVVLAVAAAAAWSGRVFAAPLSAGNVTDARVAAETPGDNWLVKGGSFAQQQFSPLRDINDKNVAHLGLAWITEMDDPMGLAAEPIVVDGVIYVSAPRSIVRAIDAANGKILWTFDPHVRLDFSMGNSSVARVNRGVAVWKGKVYVGTADGRLVAIDAAKGTLTLKDLATKKTVTVTITPNSNVRTLPPQAAAMFAARAKGAGAGTGTAGGGSPQASGAGQAEASGGGRPGGAGRSAGGDLSQLVSRLPNKTIADLKVGDAVMIVASQPDPGSATVTAVTLLSGVEPILAATPSGGPAMTLSPWNLGGEGAPEGGGGH